MTNNSLTLYKYVTLDVARIIAITSTLKFTNPSNFNDPFDCNISRLKFDASVSNIDPYVENEIQEIRKRLNDNPGITDELLERGYETMQKQKLNNSSICCFSLIPDNPLMWAHYSDKHKGACLIFDNSIKAKFINVDDNSITQSAVDYLPFSISNLLENKMEGILKLFATKSTDWKYENEFRFILLGQEGLLKFNSKFLVGIIFGINVNEKDIEDFKNNCKKENVNLFFKKTIKEKDKLTILDMP